MPPRKGMDRQVAQAGHGGRSRGQREKAVYDKHMWYCKLGEVTWTGGRGGWWIYYGCRMVAQLVTVLGPDRAKLLREEALADGTAVWVDWAGI